MSEFRSGSAGQRFRLRAAVAQRLAARLLLAGACAVTALALPRSASAAPTVRFAPPAAWVDVAEVDVSSPPLATRDVQGGTEYLLLDSQEKRTGATPERYVRRTWRVLNEGAVADGSDLTVDFDPSYETLTLHSADVIHGDGTRSRLQPGAVEVLHREASLDRRLYDGTHTALVFLEDVRVGDVVDASWTTSGANPALGGRFGYAVQLAWTTPVGRSRHRLLHPATMTVATRGIGCEAEPVKRQLGDTVELLWDARDIAAQPIDGERPWWHRPLPLLQVSSHASWAGVARWGRGLFEPGLEPNAEVRAIAQAIQRARERREDQALEALRFVQQEVRYLGLEFGPGAYEPASCQRVLARRFGDCKDKAALLVTLLRELELQAYPVLVDSDGSRDLAEGLPSHAVFDHAVVLLRHDGSEYWLDGTVLHQGGTLATLQVPDWGHGLVLEPGCTALTPVKSRLTGAIESVEEIKADERSAQVLLVTTYSDLEADRVRGDFTLSRHEDIERRYLDWYARQYAGATQAAPLEVEDDREHNVITTTERYQVQDFWTRKDDGRRREVDLVALGVRDVLARPNRVERTMPLGIHHPKRVRHVTKFSAGVEFDIAPEREQVDATAFEFQRRVHFDAQAQAVVMSCDYATRVDALEPKDVQGHARSVEQAWDLAAFGLYVEGGAGTADAPEAPLTPNWSLLALGLLAFCSSTGAAIVLERWPDGPHAHLVPPTIHRLPALLAAVVTVLPFACFVRLVAWSGRWSLADWLAGTTPASAGFSPWWGPLLCLEVVHAVALLTWAVAAFVAFARGRRFAPRLVVWLLVTEATLLALENLLQAAIGAESPTPTTRLQLAVVVAVVGVPLAAWLALSRRVRETFVR